MQRRDVRIAVCLAAVVAVKVLIQVGIGGRIPDLPFAIAVAAIVGITYFPILGPHTGAAAMALIAIAGALTGFFIKQSFGFLFQDVGIVLGLLTYAEIQRVRHLPKH